MAALMQWLIHSGKRGSNGAASVASIEEMIIQPAGKILVQTIVRSSPRARPSFAGYGCALHVCLRNMERCKE